MYDGPPELNTLKVKNVTNVFNLTGKYTKKDLNRAYKRVRDNFHNDEDRQKLKVEYLKMYDNITN